MKALMSSVVVKLLYEVLVSLKSISVLLLLLCAGAVLAEFGLLRSTAPPAYMVDLHRCWLTTTALPKKVHLRAARCALHCRKRLPTL
eukprot:2877-Heterococcus_DN1.PRE.3